MGLTRPKIWDLDTNIEYFVDPITVLHQGATLANVDVGFLFNRANGLVSNVALYWNEAQQSFYAAYTSSDGTTNSNVSVTSYANLTFGNLLSINGNIYLNGATGTPGQYITSTASGTAWTSASYTGGVVTSNVYPSGNLTINSGGASNYWANVYTGNLIINNGIYYANGTVFSSGSGGTYSNVQMLANLAATGNPITIGSNLTVQSNLAVNNTLQSRLGGNVDITANALVLSNGLTGITSITQTATGNLYTAAPTVTVSAPTSQFGGVQATANANIGVVFVANIVSAGTYYTPGQTLTMVGNASTFANATFTVTAVGNSVGGTGNVTGLTLTTSGSYAIANANPVTFTSTSGSGLQVNVTYGVNQPTITNAGSGYVEQPTITFTGGGGAGAAVYATVGSPTSINSTGANLSIVLPQGEVIKVVTSTVIAGVTSGNVTGANLGVGQYANTALTATALTGNAIAAGGVGIVGNVYGTSRIGFTWVSNSSSAAFTVFNPATNSIDTYFA